MGKISVPEKYRGQVACSPKEAAEILGIAISTFYVNVYGFVRNGQIDSLQIGKRRSIVIESLLEWVEKRVEEQAS